MKLFSKDHEWVSLEGDIATIGISVHAAAELGDVTFVELPETDEDVEAGAAVSVVEAAGCRRWLLEKFAVVVCCCCSCCCCY